MDEMAAECTNLFFLTFKLRDGVGLLVGQPHLQTGMILLFIVWHPTTGTLNGFQNRTPLSPKTCPTKERRRPPGGTYFLFLGFFLHEVCPSMLFSVKRL